MEIAMRSIESVRWEQVKLEPSTLRERARDGRMPIAVDTTTGEGPIDLILPHRVARQVELLLMKETDHLTKHFTGDAFDSAEIHELFQTLRKDGMVRIGNEGSGINWSGIVRIKHLGLVFKAKPDWKDKFDWNALFRGHIPAELQLLFYSTRRESEA